LDAQVGEIFENSRRRDLMRILLLYLPQIMVLMKREEQTQLGSIMMVFLEVLSVQLMRAVSVFHL
jgi:hypothetical protein